MTGLRSSCSIHEAEYFFTGIEHFHHSHGNGYLTFITSTMKTTISSSPIYEEDLYDLYTSSGDGHHTVLVVTTEQRHIYFHRRGQNNSSSL